MALTGHLDADFQSFYTAVRQADVELEGFENKSKNVEKALNEMANSLSGRDVAAQASIAAKAVSEIGSPARLTQAELQRVGAIAEEAVEKFTRMGKVAPREVIRLADAAKQGRSSFTEIGRSIRETDNVLDLFGVHLGPARKAIEDIGFAAENGADKIGLVGTAGLAVGAAIGGWQIGRAISEFAGLDEKIGDVVLHLQGLPTVAEQSAAATADAIAKARKAHPELDVQTGDTARLLNTLDAQAAEKANKDASDIADRVNAVARVEEAIQKVNDEVRAVESSGVWASLSKQITSHAISLSELAKEYHLTDGAITQLSKDAEKNAAIEIKNAEQLKKIQESGVKNIAERIGLEDEAMKKRLEQIDLDYKAQEAQHAKDVDLFLAQSQALSGIQATNKALQEQAELATKARESISFSREYDLSKPGAIEDFKKLNPTAFVSAGLTEDYFKTHDLADAVRDGLIQFYAGFAGANAAPVRPGALGNTSGAPTAPSAAPVPGLGAPAGAPGGGFSASSGAGFGARSGLTQIYAPVQVSGVFDPSSAHAMGRVVGDAFFKTLNTQRKLGGFH